MTSRAQSGSAIAFSKNFVKPKDRRAMGSGRPSLAGASRPSKLSPSLAPTAAVNSSMLWK
jgi:hypothetical protein